MANKPTIETLSQLKSTGYLPISIKGELRKNLIKKLQSKEAVFDGIFGYEDTVIPEIERALLSKHNILLLGLRGQAKTKIARLMIELLDEWVPIIEGSELMDDPLRPISRFAYEQIDKFGDNTKIDWIHRSERYTEKLATPDVTVADLIGDVDPIKAASLKLPYSDERVIHYGLVPRSNRCIFVINELPDLQPRIQVSLFNILQEGDIQIRGFKLRMPLDIQFVFTANPEDYTHRGSIVTPLKDRIESQIITHYAKSLEVAKQITSAEAKLDKEQAGVESNDIVQTLIEEIAFQARESEYVDEKSGVSARLTISAYENLISTAERRMLLNGEKSTHVRVSDFWGVVPAITGKIELVYEGEQEGAGLVAENLISKALRKQFAELFPDPEKIKKQKKASPYQKISEWFSKNSLNLGRDISSKDFEKRLKEVKGLKELVDDFHSGQPQPVKLFLMEYVLHGMAEFSLISRNKLDKELTFKDILQGMFNMEDLGNMDDEDDFDERGRFN